MATPQTPRRRRSPLARYAPVIAVVVVDRDHRGGDRPRERRQEVEEQRDDHDTTAQQHVHRRADLLQRSASSRARSTKYTWQPNCDTTTGRRRDPDPEPAAVRARARPASNGGTTSPGVSATRSRSATTSRPTIPRTPAPEGGRRVRPPRRRPRRRTRTTSQIYAHRVRALRPPGAARAHQRQRREQRRARGQGRRRPGRRRRRVRGDGRPRAGAQLPTELARRHVLCIGQCVVVGAAGVRRGRTRRTSGRTGPSPEQTALDDHRPDQEPAPRQGRRLCRRGRPPVEAADVRAAELRHARRRVQGLVGPVLQGPPERGRARPSGTSATC